MSRPLHALDERTRGEICAVLAIGGSRAAAANYAGCSLDALRRALGRDPELARQVRRAEAQHEIVQLKNLGEAAASKTNWRAATWLLERIRPERYGPRPADAVPREQLAPLLDGLADALLEAVPSPAVRREILDRWTRLAAEFAPRRSRPGGAHAPPQN